MWKFLTAIFAVLLWLWTFAKKILFLIGSSTFIEDVEDLPSNLSKMVEWLLDVPWYIPAILATILTFALVFKLFNKGPSESKFEDGKATNQSSDIHAVLTHSEIEARKQLGNVVAGNLLHVFQEHPKTSDDPENIAAHGLINSLIANLDHHGADQTLVLLDKLRIKAADAFGEVENSFLERSHYDSISSEGSVLADIQEKWFATFNAVVSDIRDLPDNLTRVQMQKFVGADTANWKSENERAIKWAEDFLNRV